MKARPGAQPRVVADGHRDRAAPRDDAHELAVGRPPSRSPSSGAISSVSPRRSGEVYPPVCTPVLYESSRRPVVRRIGNSAVSLSTGGSCSTGVERRRRASRRLAPTGGRAGTGCPDDTRRGTATASRRAPRAAGSSCRRARATARAARPTPASADGVPQSSAEPLRRARTRSRCRRARLPGGSSALRTRCTRRSLEVTVPSASHQDAAAGSTTCAISAVLVRNMSCTTMWSRPSSSRDRACRVRFGLRRVLADDVERAELAVLHRLEHLATGACRRFGGMRRALRALELRARSRHPRRPGRRGACSASRPCRRRPARCSGRAAAPSPDPQRPTCPVSSARLMSAKTLSTAL